MGPSRPPSLLPAGSPADKTRDFLVAAPTVALPKGGGAISGIGEKFAANPVTGTASFSVPISVSPGRDGFGPTLGLSYDSGAGNGPHGLGWRCEVPSIRRKTDKGLPRYQDRSDSDVFVFSEAEDLVPLQKEVSGEWVDDVRTEGSYTVRRYRPRVEGAFARIERWTVTATGEAHWRTISRDNVTRIYGLSTSARLADPDAPAHVFEWFLEEARDEVGNVVAYAYKAEDGDNVSTSQPAELRRSVAYTYLKRIRYGNAVPFDADDFAFEVVFDYGEHDADDPIPTEATTWPVRQDAHSSFRSGFDVRCYRLCRRVLVFHRFTELGQDPLLVRSTEFAYAEDPKFTKLSSVTWRGWQDVNGSWVTETLPPVEFTWSEPVIDETVRFVEGTGDLPGGIDPRRMRWVDLDGEGLTGLLTEQAGAWYYKRSLGDGKLSPLRRLGSRPSLDLSAPAHRLMDVDGDGRMEVVRLDARGGIPSGYQPRTVDGGWEPFRKFETVPNLDWNDPNLRFVDLDGDGRADVLVTEDDVLRWFPSKGKAGFDAPHKVWKPGGNDDGPKVVFASRAEAILLADMTGDGLADLVRVRNHSVCYWPNRGYGKFGQKVQMKGAPFFDAPDRYDARRLRLADVDGSGTADLLYLGPDGARLWFNEAGNGWSAEVKLARFPSVADPNAVDVADLEGTGTACLLWSSPLLGQQWAPLRYIRLMGQGKPHLLTKVVNNLGRETRLTYTPSTAFYVADRQAGRPWATRLPFPVHCLSKAETVDHVTGHKFVQTSTYHHGFYDGAEREFRGFGLVQTRDTESFSDFEDPDQQNSDIEHHLPPVLTKTWFHTGAWVDGKRLTDAYATEYWSGDGDAGAIGDMVLPTGLSTREIREAYRALRGRVLRQEVFAEDATAAAGDPFTVAESTWEVRRLQPAGQTEAAHAAFLVVPREAISRQYERDPDDPRVAHTLTLSVDAYGNVTRQAAIAYPRRSVPTGLEPQGDLHVVVTETSYVNDDASDDRLHLGVAWETHSWELTGVAYDESAPPSLSTVDDDFDAATAIAYEATPTGGSTKEKRRLGRDRTLFWNDALTAALSAGTLGSRVLVYERYRLAYTEGLLDDVYGTRVDTDMLEDEGGYTELLSDGDWWLRSGRATLDADAFYHPTAHTDPFGNVTTVGWDDHDLFVVSVEAPLVDGATATSGLTTTADVDYRVLQPFRVTDPNGTKNEAAFDALGRVVKTAVIGREDEGDTLSSPTTEITYSVHRWEDDGLPNRVYVKARETHGGNTFLETYVYSDGGGHEVMTKVEAAPGDAPAIENGEVVWEPADPRWIGTGRTVVDNKGNVVKQYEPFFSATHEFEDETDLVEWGVTPVMTYDALGRLVRTDLPNGTFRKVVFDAWKSDTYDENDTVLDSDWYADRIGLSSGDPERRAAELTAEHADTPTTVHLDAMGRPFQAEDRPDDETVYTTVVTLDVQGNPRVLTDARDIDTQSQAFDLLGRPMYTDSPDAGETWALLDGAGQACRTWRSGDLHLHRTYDAMRRPVHLWVTEGPSGSEVTRLVEKTVYGEVLPTQDAEDGYLLGRVYRVYDTAGCVTNVAFDFEGRLLESNRRLLDDVDADPDWSDAATDTDPDDIETAVGALLSTETFTTSATWDALGRPVTQTTPDDSETANGYDEGGRLTTVAVKIRGATTATDFVTEITYNAKGQREQITYANGTDTATSYDPATFRLKTLVTTRDSDSAAVQDLDYTYDPVGNIVQIADDSQQTLYFNNTVISPTQKYVYDALYRLTEAQGRENGTLTQTGYGDPAYGDLPHGNDSTTIRTYTQSYVYDEVGNIAQMGHFCGSGSPGNWTRYYEVATDSNRLLATSIPSDDPEGPYTDEYSHNARGAMSAMPTTALSDIGLDFRDQIRTLDLGNGDDAVYHYDAAGQRVRKVVRRGQNTEERIYLGAWEVYRKSVNSTLDTERETLHVLDDQRRIAMVETLTVEEGDPVGSPTSLQRFQLDNHLGTACVEVDDAGALISYEEYHPYGSTSWHAGDWTEVSQKRYRYTGKEKDEETGLYYHGARFYAPWLGRWVSADPIGFADGVNRFAYVGGRPVAFSDPNGRGAWAAIYGRVAQMPENTFTERAAKTGWLVLAGAGRGADVIAEAVLDLGGTAKAIGSATALSQGLEAYEAAGGGAAGLAAGVGAGVHVNIDVAVGVAKGATVGTATALYEAGNVVPNTAALAYHVTTGEATPGAQARAALGGALGVGGAAPTLEEEVHATTMSAGAAAGVLLTSGVPEAAAKSLARSPVEPAYPSELPIPEPPPLPAPEAAPTPSASPRTGAPPSRSAAPSVEPPSGPRLLAGPVEALAEHHLFPRQFKAFFQRHGIDIEEYTVTVPHQSVHLRGIHGRGLGGMPGRWNERWAAFIEANPTATAAEVYQFAGTLMDEFQLSGYAIHPYRK